MLGGLRGATRFSRPRPVLPLPSNAQDILHASLRRVDQCVTPQPHLASSHVVWCSPDQPFCVMSHFRRGKLGSCVVGGASAIQLVDAPARGSGTEWSEDEQCQSLWVTSNVSSDAADASPCSAPQPPDLCAQWDFLSGADPRTMRVPPTGSATGPEEWQIFETGATTFDEQGQCVAAGTAGSAAPALLPSLPDAHRYPCGRCRRVRQPLEHASAPTCAWRALQVQFLVCRFPQRWRTCRGSRSSAT